MGLVRHYIDDIVGRGLDDDNTAVDLDGRLQPAHRRRSDPHPFTDEQRYAWIRGNRGNFLILEALNRANYDSDFDALIDAAIHAHATGRHLPALSAPVAPRRRKADWE
jgi:hypothetical protein